MDITRDLAEFYGILLGDGCISVYTARKANKINRVIRIDGNLFTDLKYYEYVKKLIKEIIGKDVTIKFRKDCNGIFIVFQKKEFSNFLHYSLKFPYGKKTFAKLEIPEIFLNDKFLLRFLLRGFFDTDGCIYFTKNNSKIRNYPIIELSNHNVEFLNCLKHALESLGFKPIFSHYCDSLKLHGKKNLRLWMKQIGSSNIDKFSKYQFWEKFGYCPKVESMSLYERLRKIGEPSRI